VADTLPQPAANRERFWQNEPIFPQLFQSDCVVKGQLIGKKGTASGFFHASNVSPTAGLRLTF
jgi:hypothetical protein